ncbi:MAG: T9SS type A sorting domain-containing protein [Flavobacteriales bacterium]|nr:T9SS type A sorting domain-containing protein [Flavobacteriales bacterium]
MSKEKQWSVHPNPATDRITLNGEVRSRTSIIVRDTQGRTVRTQVFDTAIDISALLPGTYLLQVDGCAVPVRFVKY